MGKISTVAREEDLAVLSPPVCVNLYDRCVEVARRVEAQVLQKIKEASSYVLLPEGDSSEERCLFEYGKNLSIEDYYLSCKRGVEDNLVQPRMGGELYSKCIALIAEKGLAELPLPARMPRYREECYKCALLELSTLPETSVPDFQINFCTGPIRIDPRGAFCHTERLIKEKLYGYLPGGKECTYQAPPFADMRDSTLNVRDGLEYMGSNLPSRYVALAVIVSTVASFLTFKRVGGANWTGPRKWTVNTGIVIASAFSVVIARWHLSGLLPTNEDMAILAGSSALGVVGFQVAIAAAQAVQAGPLPADAAQVGPLAAAAA